jgi:hypothetical protein
MRIVAWCLKTDSWEDYLAFKKLAADAAAGHEEKEERRYLRAALVSIFCHVEAVINDIYACHRVPTVFSPPYSPTDDETASANVPGSQDTRITGRGRCGAMSACVGGPMWVRSTAQ